MIDGLPGTVRQEVYASAPYGCKEMSVAVVVASLA